MNVREISNLQWIKAFNGNYAVFETEDSKSGLINRQGEVIYPADKPQMIFHVCEDIFSIIPIDAPEDNQIYFDANLQKEVPEPEFILGSTPELPDFTRNYKEAYWCAKNRIAVREDDLYKIMSEDGKLVVEAEFSDVEQQYGMPCNNQICVKTPNGKSGYLDLDGKIIIPIEYYYVNYEQGIGVYKFVNILSPSEYKWGLLDAKGDVMIPAIYDFINLDVTHGLNEIAVKKDGYCYFINERQEIIQLF